MIRAHAGRRHARAVPVAPCKSVRQIFADSLFWSLFWSILAGSAYWAICRWFDVFNGAYLPSDTLIIFY